MNKGKEEGLRAGDKLMGPEATGKESHWRREMIRLVFQKGPVSSSAGMLDGPCELEAFSFLLWQGNERSVRGRKERGHKDESG